jgi:hypothetical protein
VDSRRESAHKSRRATLAEEHLHESWAELRSAIPVNVFSRELLGHQSKVIERLDVVVQRTLAGFRSIFPPAQSH